MIHRVKSFSIVNEAEVDVFLEFPSFFYDPRDVGNLISGSSAFYKSSLYIWKFHHVWIVKVTNSWFQLFNMAQSISGIESYLAVFRDNFSACVFNRYLFKV